MIRRPYRPRDHTRLGIAIVAVSLVSLIGLSARASASAPYDAGDTLQAIDAAATDTGVPYQELFRRVRCETGGTFNPNAEGDGGHSHGAVQLNDYGALQRFYDVGYTNPYNPYEAVHFMAEVLHGDHPPLGSWTWTCA